MLLSQRWLDAKKGTTTVTLESSTGQAAKQVLQFVFGGFPVHFLLLVSYHPVGCPGLPAQGCHGRLQGGRCGGCDEQSCKPGVPAGRMPLQTSGRWLRKRQYEETYS